MTAVRPTNPADLNATDARQLIGRRELSPVELAEACIERVESLDHAVNAIVARDFAQVRADAKAAESAVMTGNPLGPLHGLPFGVKDMTDVDGLPTTFGSELFRHNLAREDDALVASMRRAGAVPLGKTNVPEWSAGGNTRNRVYGVTANPYDLARNCAGSSGGSAVALACGFAPLATGSDTGGSLRSPAAYCGVVGFRPSPGVVPGHKRPAALIPLATSGPMARTVKDAALMLSVIARADPADPFTVVVDGRTPWKPEAFSNLPRRDLGSIKIAATEDFGFAPTEGMIRSVFRRALKHLEPFCGVIVEAHPDCADADDVFAVLRSLQFLGQLSRMLDETPEFLGPNVTANILEGRSYSAEQVAKALIAQGAYARRWKSFFETCDFLISPAVTLGPRDWREFYPTEIDGTPTRSYYHWLALAYASTIAGHPSITIPCGRDDKGMPFGVQIVGRRHDDLGVLAIAAEMEALISGISDLAPRGLDLERLKSAPPLSLSDQFLTFG